MGSSVFAQSDLTSFEQQVASDTHNEKVVVKLILDGNETETIVLIWCPH